MDLSASESMINKGTCKFKRVLFSVALYKVCPLITRQEQLFRESIEIILLNNAPKRVLLQFTFKAPAELFRALQFLHCRVLQDNLVLVVATDVFNRTFFQNAVMY